MDNIPMKKLAVSDNLSLPAELAARTQAILAMKGMGKTYLAMKETEEMLRLKQQVVCFDPTGVWYGLRSSANGKSEGFSILIFGGDNADVPLEPTAGEYLADFVQDSGRSVIFDMSHFESLSAQDRFVTDFATRLYRAKAPKAKRNTIHLMLDEADSFAPQKPAKNQLKMLGAWEAIVRRGRSRGIGLTMITQRPAVINKNVLSQVDLLVCLRIVGIHDFKAVKEWTDLYATPDQKTKFMQSLPQLQLGEAWFWSPGWLRIFQLAKISPKITFDSSRTPEPGEKAHAPKKAAPVDLSELTDQIRATVEQAKANDPKALKSEIASLRAEILKRDRDRPTPKVEIKEKPVLKDSQITRLEKVCAKFYEAGEKLSNLGSNLSAVSQSIRNAVTSFPVPCAPHTKRPAGNKFPTAMQQLTRPPNTPLIAVRETKSKSNGQSDSTSIGGGMKRIMIALAQRPGLSSKQVGIRAGLSSKSGTFGTYLSTMRSNNWIDGDKTSMRLTDEGLHALGNYDPLPEGEALYEYWINKLGTSGAGRMLQALHDVYPNSLTKEQLGNEANISHTSGTFGTYLSNLRSLELIEGKEPITASPELFQ